MNLLLVTYSLRNSLKSYEDFFVTLRGNSLQWFHYIEQTMIVLTPLNQVDLQGKLVPFIEITDSLLIVPMPDAKHLTGLLPKEAWDWLYNVSRTLGTRTPALPPLPIPRLK